MDSEIFSRLPLETKEQLALRLSLAARSSKADFSKCAFDANGVCAQRRHRDLFIPNTPPQSIYCCCTGCRFSHGYYHGIRPRNVRPSTLGRLFDEKLGFYRHGTGCILPREHRSATCLGYSCIQIYGASGSGYRLKRPFRQMWIDTIKYSHLARREPCTR